MAIDNTEQTKGSKADLSKRPSRRTRPMIAGRRDVLTVKNKEPGYVYRVVNANDPADLQRIEDLKEIGYEIAPSPEVGDKTVNSAGTLGTSSRISTGGGSFGVVMRIPQEFYDEDFKAKQAAIRKNEMAMMDHTTHKDTDFGGVEITRK